MKLYAVSFWRQWPQRRAFLVTFFVEMFFDIAIGFMPQFFYLQSKNAYESRKHFPGKNDENL